MPAKPSDRFIYECPHCKHRYPWRSQLKYPPCHEHTTNGKTTCIEYVLIKEPCE